MGVKPSIIADGSALAAQARQLLASDPKTAVRQLRQLLKVSPEDPALLRSLAAGLRKLGKEREAERAEGDAIKASLREPMHRQAAMAVAAGQSAQATAILESILARDSTDVVALVMLGLQASLAKDWSRADSLLQRAVSLAPADPAARLALAEHFQKTHRNEQALEQLDQLKASAAGKTVALSLRARVCKGLGKLDEEVELLRRLKDMDKGGGYQLRLGHALRSLGRGEEAVAAYRAVLELQQFEGTAWWSLANLKTVRFSDEDIATMERGLTERAEVPVNRVGLNFALGKAYEDRDEPGKAYRHYAEGNRLRQQSATYRPEKTSRWVDGAIRLFTREFYAERAGAGCQAEDPIFIIGMQRSGSTLVEQILASHPLVEGTAELQDMPNLVREVGARAQVARMEFGDYIARLAPADIRQLGEDYLRSTRIHRSEDRPRFTDKLPSNWVNAPLIRLILPKAKIIDVRRDPLACCFSNWKQLYGSGLEHSYSMEWMGRYYAEYVRLMRHIDQAQPGAIHRLIYERLVDDLEGEVRRLLDYLELPFDKSVLYFHETGRSVRTISAQQVRQPINRKGLDQHRAFEQWLQPMKDALGGVLEDWQE